MDSLASKVARRFVADSIGNVPELIHQWEYWINRMAATTEPDIHKMKEAEKILAEIKPENEQDLAKRAEAAKYYSKKIYDYLFFPKVSFENFQRLGVPSIFLALLQQFDLPPAIRKKVEAIAKFYGKSRLQGTKKKEEAIDAFIKLLAVYRAQLDVAKQAMAAAKPRGTGGFDTNPKTVQAGPFTLVNTGGFDEKTMGIVAKVCEHAAHLMSSKGLGNTCYGEVLVSNNVSKSNHLAFYLVGKDEMFVRAKLKGEEHAAVSTITHELGHRLQFKILPSKKREIEAMYNRIKMRHELGESQRTRAILDDVSLRPSKGDTMPYKGDTLEVDSIDFSGRGGPRVKLRPQGEPTSKYVFFVPLEQYIQMSGKAKNVKLPEGHPSGFVTHYASTNADENFAEMISFYVEGKLSADQVEMLEAIIK